MVYYSCRRGSKLQGFLWRLIYDNIIKVLFVKLKIITHLDKGVTGLSKDTERADRYICTFYFVILRA